MDPPGQRGWAEYPFDLSWRLRLYLSELAFEVLAAYDIALHRAPDLLTCAQRGIRPLIRLIARTAGNAPETIGSRGESRFCGTLASSHRRSRTRCERSATAGSRTNESPHLCGNG